MCPGMTEDLIALVADYMTGQQFVTMDKIVPFIPTDKGPRCRAAFIVKDCQINCGRWQGYQMRDFRRNFSAQCSPVFSRVYLNSHG